jgi:serine/threonine-protein kinase
VTPAPTTTLSGAAAERTVDPAPPPASRRPLAIGASLAVMALAGGAWFVLRGKPQPQPLPPPVAVAPATVAPAPAPPPDPRFRVTIDSTPSGATILDGTLMLGKTPATLPFEREHAIQLQHEGFRDQAVEIRRDQPEVKIALTALPASPRKRTTAPSAAAPAAAKPAAPPAPAAPQEKRRGDVVKELPF